MSVIAILGAVIAGLAALVGVLTKGWRAAVADAKRVGAERDAQIKARVDDTGRLEDVIGAKNATAAEAQKNLPTDIVGVRDGVKKLGGATLPLPATMTLPATPISAIKPCPPAGKP